MKNIEEIKKILSKNKIQFQSNFKVKEIGIFGSYLKSEQTKKSDLDILVEFESPVDFFYYLELEEHLTNLLGIKVDLVMKKALKPNIGRNILKEVIYVWEADIYWFLNDILSEINKIFKFVGKMTYAEFTKDEKTIYAVTRSLEIIGEATKNIPDDVKDTYNQIPWSKISGMRNKLIHDPTMPLTTYYLLLDNKISNHLM